MSNDTLFYPNLSDAILLALHHAGWLAVQTSKPTRRAFPAALRLPRGVVRHPITGKCESRLQVGRDVRIYIGNAEPIQEQVDQLGQRWARLAQMRDAGATVEELKRAAKEEA